MQGPTIVVTDSSIPVEIFHAAGLSTVQMTDLIDDSVTSPHYLPSGSCVYCRGAETMVKKFTDPIIGVVFTSSCTAMEKLYEVYLRKSDLPLIDIIDLPKSRGNESTVFFAERLEEMSQRMKQVLEVKISNESLERAIQLNNKFRQVLRDKNIYKSHFIKSIPLSLNNIERITEEINLWDNDSNTALPRLMIISTKIQEKSISQIIKEEQGEVVLFLTDDGYPINSININENSLCPFIALAESYLENRGIKQSITSFPNITVLRGLIEEYKIDALVTISYPYCSKFSYDVAWLRSHKDSLRVPLLNLQTETITTVQAGNRSRIAALIEIIKLNKGDK